MFDDLYLDELHSTNEDYILNMDLSSSCTETVHKENSKDKSTPPVEVDTNPNALLDSNQISPSIVQNPHIPIVNLDSTNVNTVNKGIGSYLVKTPDFFKTLSSYSEKGTDVLFKADMKSQENGLFKFPMDVFMNSYKRRSYSETDITNRTKYNHQNPLLSNTHQNNSQDSHISSRIYQTRRNSISVPSVEDLNFNAYYRKYYSTTYVRSTVESCIDPRSFYKSVPTKSYNKENIAKPSFSYAQMITRAISSHPEGKLSLGDIYKWIESNFDYYKYANPVWKNSIRHNLSLSKCFKKVPREPGSRGKGGKWMIDKDYLYQEEVKKKRKIFEDDENRDTANLNYSSLSPSTNNNDSRFY